MDEVKKVYLVCENQDVSTYTIWAFSTREKAQEKIEQCASVKDDQELYYYEEGNFYLVVNDLYIEEMYLDAN